MGMRFSFYTLGCKLNYSESNAIGRLLEGQGYTQTAFGTAVDLVIINTCSVTDHADRKCKRVVREALKTSPAAKVVVIGCYAQLKPKEITEMPGVSLVLGAAEKFNLAYYVEQLGKEAQPAYQNSSIHTIAGYNHSYSFGERARAFLKVQDGCDYSCSFCTIPLARGQSRSPDIAELVVQAQKIADEGAREIVLTGVNIGDYGHEVSLSGQTPSKHGQLLSLLKALEQVEGIERFRISSIEPNLLSDAIIEFVAGSLKYVPHFHVPLQSGSNTVLRDMRRRYKRELYASRIGLIKSLMPDACIGGDVIVGFPTESRALFEETKDFITDLELDYLHVFPFSARTHTVAAGMVSVVSDGERAARREKLQRISDKKRALFYLSQAGQTRQVIWENELVNGLLTGVTDNYVKVLAQYSPELVGELSWVTLTELDRSGKMLGQHAEEMLVH